MNRIESMKGFPEFAKQIGADNAKLLMSVVSRRRNAEKEHNQRSAVQREMSGLPSIPAISSLPSLNKVSYSNNDGKDSKLQASNEGHKPIKTSNYSSKVLKLANKHGSLGGFPSFGGIPGLPSLLKTHFGDNFSNEEAKAAGSAPASPGAAPAGSAPASPGWPGDDIPLEEQFVPVRLPAHRRHGANRARESSEQELPNSSHLKYRRAEAFNVGDANLRKSVLDKRHREAKSNPEDPGQELEPIRDVRQRRVDVGDSDLQKAARNLQKRVNKSFAEAAAEHEAAIALETDERPRMLIPPHVVRHAVVENVIPETPARDRAARRVRTPEERETIAKAVQRVAGPRVAANLAELEAKTNKAAALEKLSKLHDKHAKKQAIGRMHKHSLVPSIPEEDAVEEKAEPAAEEEKEEKAVEEAEPIIVKAGEDSKSLKHQLESLGLKKAEDIRKALTDPDVQRSIRVQIQNVDNEPEMKDPTNHGLQNKKDAKAAVEDRHIKDLNGALDLIDVKRLKTSQESKYRDAEHLYYFIRDYATQKFVFGEQITKPDEKTITFYKRGSPETGRAAAGLPFKEVKTTEEHNSLLAKVQKMKTKRFYGVSFNVKQMRGEYIAFKPEHLIRSRDNRKLELDIKRQVVGKAGKGKLQKQDLAAQAASDAEVSE